VATLNPELILNLLRNSQAVIDSNVLRLLEETLSISCTNSTWCSG